MNRETDIAQRQFVQMMERQKTFIWRMCYRACGREKERCKDLVQEVCLALWRGFSNLREKENIKLEKAWVWWHIRTQISHLERERKEDTLPDDYEKADVDALLSEERKEALEEIMTPLGKREREVVAMRMEGYDYQEIGQQMGISAAGAKQTMYRAMEKMKKECK
ncbi:MAG: sigma-70 family RNA polymerase sigma factor [Bacteroidales bacterium]|nr:sigma-70 family RNA polymerase sigma factor [Bacteroidales bacterium]